LNPDERLEDLFQRLMAFVEDSLIKPHTLSHHGSVLEEEEELSPALENFVILTWLRLINPALPKLVKQRYGTELRSRTLASLKPEILQALDSLLDEIRSAEDTKVKRTEASFASNLDVDVLAGTPFMETNDKTIRPAKRQVILGDGTIFTYGSVNHPPTHNAVRRVQVLRAPSSSTTVWPGDFIEIVLPEDSLPDAEYALGPRFDATNARSAKVADMWPPPCLITSVAGRVRIPNLSDRPYVLKRNEHFCQVNPIFFPSIQDPPSNPVGDLPSHKVCSVPVSEPKYSQGVALDPDNLLPPAITTKFRNLLAQYDSVFDPAITGYNGAFGPLGPGRACPMQRGTFANRKS